MSQQVIFRFKKKTPITSAWRDRSPAKTTRASDPLDYNITLETQVSILQSETLALEVARQLDLEYTDDYAGKKHLIHIPSWMKPWEPRSESPSIPLEDAPGAPVAVTACICKPAQRVLRLLARV